MSDRWLNVQHYEIKRRNRERREAAMREADQRARAANARRHR